MEEEKYSAEYVLVSIVIFFILGVWFAYGAGCEDCVPIGCEEYNEDGYFLACYNYGLDNIKVIPISGSILPQTVTEFKAEQDGQWYHVKMDDGAVVKRPIEKPY